MRCSSIIIFILINAVTVAVSILIKDDIYVSFIPIVLAGASLSIFIIWKNEIDADEKIPFRKMILCSSAEIYDKLNCAYRDFYTKPELQKELCLTNLALDKREYVPTMVALLVLLIGSMATSMDLANSLGMHTYAIREAINHDIFMIESIIIISIACYMDNTFKAYGKIKKCILENRLDEIG